ncbi:MAG TPA: VanW family protein, partial [Syntrophomonadaceae bacterium]|nr:VanW family protein [Syntrophomonadaceae bacterium]
VILSLFFRIDNLMAYDKILGSFQLKITDAESSENAYNAITAALMLDNTKVESGDTFSYNNIIGIRTPDKGFIKGLISSKTKYPIYKYGGGICMTSSILHQAVKATDLLILERHNHVASVGYLPIGEDAAITWKTEDYRFYNNLAHPIVIKSYIDNETIQLSIFEQLPSSTIFFMETELYFANEPFIDQGTTYVEMGETIDLLKLSSKEIITLFDEITNHIMPTYTTENMTYLPLRELANLLNLQIHWDGEKGQVQLQPFTSVDP